MGSIRYGSNALNLATLYGDGVYNTAPYTTTKIAGLSSVYAGHISLGTVAASGNLQGVFIYQGTPMAQADLDAFPKQTDLTMSPRYSDLLFAVQSTGNGSRIVATKATAALKTGVATWALVGEMKTYPYLCLLSVSTVGGGGEIELLDTNIIAGNVYKLGTITLTPNMTLTW